MSFDIWELELIDGWSDDIVNIIMPRFIIEIEFFSPILECMGSFYVLNIIKFDWNEKKDHAYFLSAEIHLNECKHRNNLINKSLNGMHARTSIHKSAIIQ